MFKEPKFSDKIYADSRRVNSLRLEKKQPRYFQNYWSRTEPAGFLGTALIHPSRGRIAYGPVGCCVSTQRTA